MIDSEKPLYSSKNYPFWLWILFGILAVFIAIPFHEGGHFVVAFLSQAKALTFYSGEVNFDNNSVTAIEQVLIAAGGLVVTFLLTVIGYWGVLTKQGHPFYYLLAISSQVRGFVGALYFYNVLRYGVDPFNGTYGGNAVDEESMAYFLGISPAPIFAFSVFTMVVVAVLLPRKLFSAGGWRAITYCIISIFVGLKFYFVLAPVLLGK